MSSFQLKKKKKNLSSSQEPGLSPTMKMAINGNTKIANILEFTDKDFETAIILMLVLTIMYIISHIFYMHLKEMKYIKLQQRNIKF